MVLTHQQRNQPDNDSFPTTQLLLLAICRVAEPIALTSIFPYAWPMVKSFAVGDANNASFYAGILISSFALTEALTSMFWGSLSDRVGRKPVLLLGCAGTILSLLMVGFASNFWVALIGRALGGCLNGNIPVIQTMVGELVRNPKHERKFPRLLSRAYAVMPFVWSIGTIIGPAIGGFFARPAEVFPTVFSPIGIFAKFPYLLPNLICAGMLLMSIVFGYLFIHETHPDMQPWSTAAELENTVAETPLLGPSGGIANAWADLRNESYGTFNHVDMHVDVEGMLNLDPQPHVRRQKIEYWQNPSASSSRPPSIKEGEEPVFTKRLVMLVLALGIFSFHAMSYDHLLPIFLQDSRTGEDKPAEPTFGSSSIFTTSNTPLYIPGGLGLSTTNVGIIMSINGVIALFIQGFVFPLIAENLGVFRTFLLATILHPVAYFIVPFVALLPSDLVYIGIYSCLTIRNVFSILAYPVILILIKEACPRPSVLGTVNGLAASMGAGARTLAPPLAGLLYGLGKSTDFTGWAWWASGVVAALGAVQLFWIGQQRLMITTVSVAQPVGDFVRAALEEGEHLLGVEGRGEVTAERVVLCDD